VGFFIFKIYFTKHLHCIILINTFVSALVIKPVLLALTAMKKSITTVFVNLQQGFIIDELSNIVGAYSHHHEAVAIKIPYRANDFDWVGTKFEDYAKVDGATDSFSINCYTLNGEQDLSDLLLATT